MKSPILKSIAIDPLELLNSKETARLLDISPGTLDVWACTGRYKLPYVKVGGLRKYKRSDIEAFIKSRTCNYQEVDRG